MKNTEGATPPLDEPPCSALYRAAVSGLWYDSPAAAGTVTAVICKNCRDGVERKPGETMTFIRRVADFWKEHQTDPCHAPNAEVRHGGPETHD